MTTDDLSLAGVILPHSIWMDRGFRIMNWVDENFPADQYRLRFQRTRNGKLIPASPVQIVFDTVEAATMCRLKWCSDVGN
jgi:hypothetical protein